ncbi:MAG: HAD family hydrolase [Actinobacteria bacterium]|nr:MAG: HAD family hydrolase [Microbacterium sp.]RUA25995.1 MAG: HAD family hydrolase [Actinomycetota bacterium]
MVSAEGGRGPAEGQRRVLQQRRDVRVDPSGRNLVNADLSDIRGWVFDVDGCLIRTAAAGGHGGQLFPGAREILNQLHDAGHKVIVCTNASERPPEVYAEHLREIGLPVRDDAFVTAGSAAADHVLAHHPGARVLVVGAEGVSAPMRERGLELVEPGSPLADVVVVGAAASYDAATLNAAALAVADGAAFYTTAGTPWFHGGRGRSLAVSASIAASVSFATGREPIVAGKPSAVLAESLLRRLDVPGSAAAVVGDALAEIQLAHHMGGTGILLLSGATSLSDLDTLPQPERPDIVVDDVAVLHRRLAPQSTRQGA